MSADSHELVDPYQVRPRYAYVGECGTEEHPHRPDPTGWCWDCHSQLAIRRTSAVTAEEMRAFMDQRRA